MRPASVVACVIGLVAASAGLAGDRPAPAAAAGDDVVREVVRMLDAGVAEEVVLRWLERERRRPETVSPDDLIALTAAGASPELIGALLAPPRATPPRRPPRRVPPPRSRPPGPPSATTSPVEFSIRYRPYRDPDADEDEQWHLFVYVDGRLLAWADGKQWLSRSKRNRDVRIELDAGPHVVRLLQERHARRGSGWRHEARVCPEPIPLRAVEGETAVEIEVREPVGLGFGTKGTFRWALLDGDHVVEEHRLSGPPDGWPPLCEEIESNHAGATKVPRRARKQLARCVRWDDLWEGVADVPDRATVRSRLERHDYRPVLASE